MILCLIDMSSDLIKVFTCVLFGDVVLACYLLKSIPAGVVLYSMVRCLGFCVAWCACKTGEVDAYCEVYASRSICIV